MYVQAVITSDSNIAVCTCEGVLEVLNKAHRLLAHQPVLSLLQLHQNLAIALPPTHFMR